MGILTIPAGADGGAFPTPRNNYGTPGLIDMPSARMAPDGAVSAGASFFENTQRYVLGFQVLPWLEGSFRYTGLQRFDPAYPVYYDRSFALKTRLWDESEILPAFAVGVNDLVGTGIYAGEYIVASKRFGAVDTSLGIGWGRLGTAAQFDNPLGAIAQSFKTRDIDSTPGGVGNIKTLFHGRSAGLFGGVTWYTPLDGLSLTVEYSSDAYAQESRTGNFLPKNQINLGAAYQVSDNIAVGLNWLYGRSIGGNISFQFDPKTNDYPQKMGASPPDPKIRSDEEQRQALNTLLEERHPAATRQTAMSRHASRTARKNAFVEGLWRQSGGVPDIGVRGRTLVLVAPRWKTNCVSMVQLVKAYARDLDTIELHNPSGVQHRCTVQNDIRSTANITENYPPHQMFLSASTFAAEVSTINAASSWPDAEAGDKAILREAAAQKLTIEAIHVSQSQITLYYSNSYYFSERVALDRLVRILMAYAPVAVEKFRLISVKEGIPQQEFNILRSPQERDYLQNGRLSILGSGTTIAPPPLSNPILERQASSTYARFSWEVFPKVRSEFFDPGNPFGTQLLLGAHGKLSIAPGLSLDASVESSLYDNFQRNRVSNSVLPRVRSDFLNYFAQGKTGIGNLNADYRFRLTPDTFAVLRAGYLESMFAGVGGEVLWRPFGQRLAFGADLYHVWQRNFDRLFGLRGYNATTGHLSVYYASPWYGLNFVLRGGQYLARDKGVTLEITRRFSTGVEIGAFATKTNVPAALFGEGSFDKGIIIRIPVGWISPIETQGQLGIDLRPVQRDGGQRLAGDTSLYDETRRTSLSELWNASIDP